MAAMALDFKVHARTIINQNTDYEGQDFRYYVVVNKFRVRG